MLVIDTKDLIVGRMATVVAKAALKGETINIVNAEHALITGKKVEVLAKFKRKRDIGVPLQGPYFPKMPDRFLRRIIRGMLPWKNPRGKEAFKRIICHIGVPSEFEGKATTIKEASIKKLPNVHYTSVAKICNNLGAKV